MNWMAAAICTATGSVLVTVPETLQVLNLSLGTTGAGNSCVLSVKFVVKQPLQFFPMPYIQLLLHLLALIGKIEEI